MVHCFLVPRPLPARETRRYDRRRSLLLAAGGSHFGSEIGFLLLDSLAESIAHKSGDLHRRADLALSFLQRLGNRLAAVMDESLFEQADFLVISLEAGLDDLLDDIL